VDAIESALGPPDQTLTTTPLRELAGAFVAKYEAGVADGVFRPRDLTQLTALMYGAVLGRIAWPYGTGGRRELNPRDLMGLEGDLLRIFHALVRSE
jgi:hypothetical protein